MFFRLLLIAVFHRQIGGETGLGDLLLVLGTGLRYDISTAAAWATIPFLLSISAAFIPWGRLLHKLRLIWVQVYVVVALLLFGVDLVYFDEYNDQFNSHIFGIAHDDTVAILITIWKEYHPLWFFAILIPLLYFGLHLAKRWMAVPGQRLLTGKVHGHLFNGVKAVGLFLLFVALVRGGLLWGEPMRYKHAFVVKDLFLNRTVVTPFFALRDTLETKLELERGGGLKQIWPGGDIESALRTVVQSRGGDMGDGGIDAAMEVSAPGWNNLGALKQRPKHLFMVLLESHSGWTVMPAYRDAGFSPKLSELAEDGIYLPNFISAASGTIGSMNTLITGLPDSGLNINYETTALTPYPSALAEQFHRLGYTTRFFYGGYLSWQRLDSFGMAQGFDEVYGGGSMSDGAETNEWGVADSHLFDFVLETVDKERDKPSLNFILSTSNHPPYDLDLEGLGYPHQRLPEELQQTKGETIKVLGHLWYTDRELGRFAHSAVEQLPGALLAITGDHTARLGIDFPGNDALENVAVPLVLYGPDVINSETAPRSTPGSHIDLPPTLIETVAPAGYRYPSYGQSLWRDIEPRYSGGYRYIIGGDRLIAHQPPHRAYALSPGESVEPMADGELKALLRRDSALTALGWYRVRRGDALPDKENPAP